MGRGPRTRTACADETDQREQRFQRPDGSNPCFSGSGLANDPTVEREAPAEPSAPGSAGASPSTGGALPRPEPVKSLRCLIRVDPRTQSAYEVRVPFFSSSLRVTALQIPLPPAAGI